MPEMPSQFHLLAWPGDSLLVMEASQYLSAYGHLVRSAGSFTDLLVSLGGNDQHFLLVDWDVLQRQPDADRASLRQAMSKTVLVCLSRNAGITSRLGAVRHGAQGYFCLPLEKTRLLAGLERLGERILGDAGRVLIVDDSPSSALYHARALNQAGLRAHAQTNPLQVLDSLHELAPELILMDLYMPDANGLELAQVIRQQHAYMDVPIVFLSAESDPARQREAMALGGDEFLQKPIPPELLVSAVRTRIDRYRGLRQLMVRDGLTGLLNRVHFTERLGMELVRSRRTAQPLSMAMLGIDHFQQIAAIHGPVTGDRVIRSLGRLLRQRLRASDVVCRYDGEAFAVVLPDTTRDFATKVVNDLREVFAGLPQSNGDQVFHCNFSAGLAQLKPDEDRESLVSQAGLALLEAKQAGRGRVVALN